jgi:hypothetical protein
MTQSTVAKIVALVALVASLAVLLTQVEASDSAVGATRTCGSAFDSAIDRSGWDLWWASDLDEPDPSVRSALVRTRRCPDEVNKRLAVAAALGALAVGSAVLALARDGLMRRRGAPTTVGDRVVRLGLVSTWMGLSLSLAGVIAVIVLIADADSTLFLYTDRFVVAVVGLIVLTPTIALFVIGRVLTIIGTHLGEETPESDDAQIA